MNATIENKFSKGWTSVQLFNCVKILDSKRIPINTKDRNSRIEGKAHTELTPYYGATGQVGWIDGHLFDEELVLLGEDGAPFFDYSKDTAYMIKGKSWVNNHAHVLRAIAEMLNNKFLCHYLNTFDFHGYVTGTTRLKLNQGRMKEMPVPLPPFAEQGRIVAKIEELFSDLDAGVAALKKVRAEIKRYRQAVLKNAFQGKLTAKWRKKNKDKIEPASKLLERIKAEREKNTKGKKQKELPPLDTSNLPEIPEGWEWARIINIGMVSGGLTKNSKRNKLPLKMPYLRVANVYARKLNLEEVKEIGVAEKELPRLLLQKGDLLVVEGNGSVEQIGRVAIWDGSIKPCVHQNHLIKVRFNFDELNDWAVNWLTSIEGRKQIVMVASSTSGLHTLSISKICSLPIAVASLSEQKEIVSEIERRFSIADNAEKIVEQALKQAGRLRQSILKRAFQGKLVPQDPNDEPAEKLLERIKTAKFN